MKKTFLFHFSALLFFVSNAQSDLQRQDATRVPQKFTPEKSIAATPVKNQAMTGTCWCFSTISLVESQCLKNGLGQMDISEMFSVRNIYIEKAKNYILRQAHAQFSEGGLGHDLIRAIAAYGAVPENEYTGLTGKQQKHNHVNLFTDLKQYLDSVVKLRPVPQNWLGAYINRLDQALGKPPVDFIYQGKRYTPISFAKEVLKFDADDYVNITSFKHHPFYTPFIIEVPDNFSNGAYYNLPLQEMMEVAKDAIRAGYSVVWDADVSNTGFLQQMGIAVNYDSSIKPNWKTQRREFGAEKDQQKKTINQTDGAVGEIKTIKPGFNNTVGKTDIESNSATGIAEEAKWDSDIRQALFENLTTQDDHLMHITGLEKSAEGKTYFLVKNSLGEIGPSKGYINVSEGYFAINTISLIIPKAALSKTLLEKLKLK